jgi:hypothetical protein
VEITELQCHNLPIIISAAADKKKLDTKRHNPILLDLQHSHEACIVSRTKRALEVITMGKKSKSQSEHRKGAKAEANGDAEVANQPSFLAGNAPFDPLLASLFETSVRVLNYIIGNLDS